MKQRCNCCSPSSRRVSCVSADWPMWGGTPSRNMVSPLKGMPTPWDVKSGKNVKWVAELGSQSYGNPVVARRRRADRHQQRSHCATPSRPAIAAS